MSPTTATLAAVAAAVACLAVTADAASNSSYYGNIDFSLKDDAMIKQLFTLINPHNAISYDDVWTAYESTDSGGGNCSSGQVNCVYSGLCYEPSAHCGSGNDETSYNREHTWPKSWWGGFSSGKGAQTDLFHLRPANCHANSVRGNNPYGLVDPSDATFSTPTGSRSGPCSSETGAPSGTTCFEVADEYKGDVARGYFYLSVAYRNQWTCCVETAVNEFDIDDWQETMLRTWHTNDPVSPAETQRNEVIYTKFQQNRNPFIDHPELVDSISDF